MRDEDEAEIEALLARQRRHSFRRAMVFGLIALAGALAGVWCFRYGESLEAAQAHSDVQFVFPSRLMLLGIFLATAGGLGAVASFVVGLRLRLRKGF